MDERLYGLAAEAALKAYAPYSRFRVGAALLCEDGEVFTGVNVENRSYGLSICGERSAFVAAVSAGKRKFKALALSTPDADYPVPPCGACRQVLTELCPPGMPVTFGPSAAKARTLSLGDLYPEDSLRDLAEKGN
jgi:cytidine deaminase